MITTYGLQVVDINSLLSRLVYIDVETGKIVKTSPVQVIRNRTIIDTENGFAAVAGENVTENQAIRLVILDKENMEIISQTEEDVAPNAVLIEDDNYLYTVVETASGNVISVKLVQLKKAPDSIVRSGSSALPSKITSLKTKQLPNA